LCITVISSTTANVNLTFDDASGGFLYGTATGNLQTGVTSNGKVTGGTVLIAGPYSLGQIKTGSEEECFGCGAGR
jgi:hypothetical protein